MPEGTVVHFTISGFVFMVASWTVITALAAFCFTRLLRSGPKREDNEAIGSSEQMNEEPNE